MDWNESCDDVAKSESYYYASLFEKCDEEERGFVKVSVLLRTLQELRAMAMNSDGECDDDGGNSLLELKGELDPKNVDPDITLQKFTEGITAFLEKSSRWRSYDSEGMPEMCDTNSKVMREQEELQESEKETLRKQKTDMLNAEILDLKQHLQKVTDDNLLLRGHVTAAQDENCSVLQALEGKTLELKAQAERVKRLEREMDDKTEIISSLEERNAVLCNKFSKLGNEIAAFHKERKKLASENVQLKEEVQKTLQELTLKADQLNKTKSDATLADLQWHHKEKMLNERISTLNRCIDELDVKVQDMEQKHLKLKQATMEKREFPTALSCAEEFAAADGILKVQPLSNSIPPASCENFENFLSNFMSDDIETEMVEVGEIHQTFVLRSAVERFDVAVQCEKEDVQDSKALKDFLQSTPSTKSGEKFLYGKLGCSENQAGLDMQDKLSDHYLVAEYIPQENCNELVESMCEVMPKTGIIEIFLKAPFRNTTCLMLLFMVGLFMLLVTPIDDGCITNPFMFRSIESYFKYCGRLSHEKVPII